MRATYRKDTNCNICYENYSNYLDSDICAKCIRDSLFTVDVLQLGCGENGDKAVIMYVTGKLETVPMKRLTMHLKHPFSREKSQILHLL